MPEWKLPKNIRPLRMILEMGEMNINWLIHTDAVLMHKKKKYSKPVLIRHGKLAEQTLAGGDVNNDADNMCS